VNGNVAVIDPEHTVGLVPSVRVGLLFTVNITRFEGRHTGSTGVGESIAYI
jgi:hypothetical protein